MLNKLDELTIETFDRPRLVRSEESVHAWHGAAIGFKAAVQAYIDNFIDDSHLRSGLRTDAVSYTHLTLPTTPYV